MKILRLKIHNIGIIADETIELNKPLLLFYGEIRQGKTTILNCVRWVCGGTFPTDIIRHGEKEASIDLEFEGGVIARSFYKDKKNETASRPLIFVRNGKPVSKPATELQRFLNPFLLDQDYLRNMGETERKSYFAELFAVDTTELDKEWFDNDRRASNLRIEVKSYGEIDLTPIERVDTDGLKAKLRELTTAYDEACEKVDSDNEFIREYNSIMSARATRKSVISTEIASLETKLKTLKSELAGIKVEAAKELKAKPAKPDTSALETKIQEAGAANVRAEQFIKNKARAQEKTDKEGAVKAIEERQREIKIKKVALLKGISEKCGIKDLSFDEDGTFTYQGTQAGMLSTSQIMRLSSELSGLYPDGFGLELLDRGESLGASIFEYVERAKKEEISILATIVGERPAKVPDDIGVFVVKEGKVTK